MSEEETKEKRQKTKIKVSSLLVVLSCICFILALLPLLITSRPPPHYRLWCNSNLATLGRAILLYANDYDDKLPTPSKWCDLLIEHGNVTKKHFKCRSAEGGPCNYAMNKNAEKLGLDNPNDMVLLFETYPGWNQVGDLEILTTANHKDKGCNVLFMDCYVGFVKKQDLQKLKWKPDEAQDE